MFQRPRDHGMHGYVPGLSGKNNKILIISFKGFHVRRFEFCKKNIFGDPKII